MKMQRRGQVAESSAPYYLRERRQLLATVSPVRQEILDGLAAVGPCTVAELAALIGRKPTALYQHLTRLERVGLLARIHGEGGEKGRPRVRYDVVGRPILLDIETLAAIARAPLERYVAAMMRNAVRGYSRALRSPGLVHSGPQRNLWAASWKGWLNAAEAEQATALLAKLIALLKDGTSKGQAGRRLTELSFVFAPTTRR
jgi:predicted transcriptional regulator